MYTFEMDESESFAKVFYEGAYVADVKNCPIEDCLSSSQNGLRHVAVHDLNHDVMWDEFYAWAETMVGKGIVERI